MCTELTHSAAMILLFPTTALEGDTEIQARDILLWWYGVGMPQAATPADIVRLDQAPRRTRGSTGGVRVLTIIFRRRD
jgi:hypothetical protein